MKFENCDLFLFLNMNVERKMDEKVTTSVPIVLFYNTVLRSKLLYGIWFFKKY